MYIQASPDGRITDERNPAASLAKLTLKKFKAGTKMISNGEMTAIVSMQDCLLDDGRPEKKNGITKYAPQNQPSIIIIIIILFDTCTFLAFRLIRRGSDGNDDNANQGSLIEFKYTKSETNDTTGQYSSMH